MRSGFFFAYGCMIFFWLNMALWLMSVKKIRKEKLSIYLARDATKDNADLLKVENSKNSIPINLDGVDDAVLYVKKEPPKHTPPWTRLFTTSEQVPDDTFGTSSTVGALFVVRAFGQIFMLSFGTGFHLLKSEEIERDFGLRVTLNSVDPDNLRSLDKASYDHNPLNSRTQSTKGVDIFELHIDSELDLLYAVTGRSNTSVFGTHVTGRDALTVIVETNLNKISEILKEAHSKYKLKLPAQFEWVDNINRVRDADDIEILDLELDSALKNGKTSNFWLGEPEIVDWENQIGYSFDNYKKTPVHVVLSLDDYHNHLKGKNRELSIDSLKNDLVHINNSEYSSIKSWSVYRCIYAELVVGEEQYILRDGIWHRVNTDFVKSIDDYLNNEIKACNYLLPIYDHDREEDYNTHVSTVDASFFVMDKKNIGIGGRYSKLEFCDLIKDGKEFIHVKYYRSSSTLSHLFAQGNVAAEAFISDADFREKLNKKLPSNACLLDPKTRPNPSDYTVVYAIATTKNIPNELPFFSKVTLKNALKTLRALNYKVELSRINVSPELLVKKKIKPNK